ncbi:MAG: winged helix-turn-helix transcriptional regulator [Arenicella sp.]|nr:winged helix-turn-helix transcriptional regulator [Arenicella sp.]
MMNDTEVWLERLNSLYKSQTRKAVNIEGIQLVHFEILQYLSICNHYSNTAQALSEYLGQTKGSISQSLKIIENLGHIERRPCTSDKRVVRLYVTKAGLKSLQRVSKDLALSASDAPSVVDLIKSSLMRWQTENHHHGFGQCKSCKYNIDLDNEGFRCGLTQDPLSKTDVNKICREHEFLTLSDS